jgi:hypothetical protein
MSEDVSLGAVIERARRPASCTTGSTPLARQLYAVNDKTEEAA